MARGRESGNKMNKIELGGYKRDGFTTINLRDSDVCHDLNKFPYPLKDNSEDEIWMFHTLELLDNPLEVMREIWRVCTPGAEVFIKVPHHSINSIKKNPFHKFDFHEDWFKTFDSTINLGSAFNPTATQCEFRILSIKNTRGKIKFWKMSELIILMEILK